MRKSGLIFAVSVFLVAVPVFIEAPLVRHLPGVSLALTLGWVGASVALLLRRSTAFWGDLLLGFAGSWLAGSLYWGWLRWEPLWHLPVEAIALPLPIWCLCRGRLLVGSWFALGSFFGTALTDGYFYLVDLMPSWRELMRVEPELVVPIFQEAIAQVRTPWGILWAAILATALLLGGLLPLGSPNPRLHYWAFSGAVLSTILVDALFWLAALSAVG
ncbi:MAG: DUF3120 domain-containing protein [Cyanobacteriota bacterium]|nr:DUF3120 domain-containing protein [Cyanobacteriota bacterium]